MSWIKCWSRRLAFLSILVVLSIPLFSPIFTPSLTSSAQAPVATTQVSSQATHPWNIHLYALPSSDGSGLFAFTGQTANVCRDGIVKFNAVFLGSPTPFDGEYNKNDSIYRGFLDNFFAPGTEIQEGTLEVICDLPNGDRLVSQPPITFVRYYYPDEPSPIPIPILSKDNNAILTLFESSLNAPHFIIVMTTNALPGPLPAGTVPVSLPYSFRASGLTFESDQNMSLNLRYSIGNLGDADPLTLRIIEWDVINNRWVDSGEQNLSNPAIDSQLNRVAKKFTTYILASTPRWLDSFTTDLGLETQDNVKRIPAAGKLSLDDLALPGMAISNPYTPTLPLRAWQTVSYTANIPAGANLTVDVLSRDRQLLKAEVTPGQSLIDLDPALYPSLRLRVKMATASPDSPELLAWSLLAEPADYTLYLPALVKD